MPKRTYDPPSSHITTPDSPSPHGPSVRLVLRAPDAGRRPLRGRSGRGRPVRMPGASRPGRRRSSSSGTTRRHAPGAPAQGPGTRPRGAPPAPWSPPDRSGGTRCRSAEGLCRIPPGRGLGHRAVRGAVGSLRRIGFARLGLARLGLVGRLGFVGRLVTGTPVDRSWPSVPLADRGAPCTDVLVGTVRTLGQIGGGVGRTALGRLPD